MSAISFKQWWLHNEIPQLVSYSVLITHTRGFIARDTNNMRQQGGQSVCYPTLYFISTLFFRSFPQILWFQMIAYARLHKKSIIFITDDVKDDWWRRVKGKTLGPRPELVKEIFDESGVSFYMYTADNFINRAQEFLGVQVQPATIEEVRELRHQDEAIQNKAQTVNVLYSELAGLGAILQHREHIQHMEKMFGGRSELAVILKQGQETAKLINSIGGIRKLNWLAADARRAHQLYYNLGIASPFITNPVSDGKDADTTDMVQNQADQDIDNEG